MLELAAVLQTAPIDALPEQAPTLIGAAKDLALPMAAVYGAYNLGRRYLMGYYLPDDCSGVDFENVSSPRDRRAGAVMAMAYAVGVLLTATAVWMLTSLAWALAWAGGWSLIAAAIALLAARDASPISDMRMLFEARRQA